MKYRFTSTTYFQGKHYHAGQEYELSAVEAHALGFPVKEAPKQEAPVEVKQQVDYSNKQMTSKKKK